MFGGSGRRSQFEKQVLPRLSFSLKNLELFWGMGGLPWLLQVRNSQKIFSFSSLCFWADKGHTEIVKCLADAIQKMANLENFGNDSIALLKKLAFVFAMDQVLLNQTFLNIIQIVLKWEGLHGLEEETQQRLRQIHDETYFVSMGQMPSAEKTWKI